MNNFDEALGAAIANAIKPLVDAANGLTTAVNGLTDAVKNIPSSGTGDGGGGGTSGPPPLPPAIPDTQKVWTMADATVTPTPSGHEYAFGTGPNEIKTSVNFSAGKPIGFAVFVGSASNEFAKHVASGMVPASNNGTNLGDTFVFRGDYPPGCSISIIQDPTLQSGWWNFVTLDDLPYETTGNYDGTLYTHTEVFDSANQNMKWVIAGTAAGGGTGGGGGGTPTVVETKTTIQVTDNTGKVRTLGPDILSKLMAQTSPTADIDVRVLQDCNTVGCIMPAVPPPGYTFGGLDKADGTRVKFNVTGFLQSQMLQQGAGVLIFPPAVGPKVANLVNMEIFGAHIPLGAGGNCPAIREKTTAGVTPSLTVNAKNLYLHDNDDGCLVGCFNQEGCILEKNGGAGGKTHNSYAWNPAATETINGGASLSPTVGYLEKMRCQKSVITGRNYRTDQSLGGGIDYAYGGDHELNAPIEHATIVQDKSIIRFLTEAPPVMAPLNRLVVKELAKVTAHGGTVYISNGPAAAPIDPNAQLDLTAAPPIADGSTVELHGWLKANVTPSTLPAGYVLK